MALTKAYLSLGSNIEPKKNLTFAIEKLRADFDQTVISSVYKTAAQGFKGEDFLNLAVEIRTPLSLDELLAYTNQLEQLAGRVRKKRGHFDSRTLDVDIVIFGDLVGSYRGKVFPAEDLREYGHVLKPLSEIAKKTIDPKSGYSMQQLWDRFKGKQDFENTTQIYECGWLRVDS